MSASREKKLRQGAGGYSEKAAKARQEDAANKRKAAIYTAIGAVVVVLVAALLIWNSGFFQRQKTAITVGDTGYKVNELSYYYHMQTSRYMFASYGLLDSSLTDDEQMYDSTAGTTYRDVFLEEATEAITRVTALYDKAIEEGYTESQVKDRVDEVIDGWKSDAAAYGYSYSAFLKASFGKYMTTGDFEDILTRAAVADAYYSDATESIEYTEDDLQAYYEENANSLDTFDFSYFYFKASYETPKNEDGTDKELTDEEEAQLKADAMAEAKEKADAVLAALNEGADPFELAEEYPPDQSADHTVTLGSSLTAQSFSEDLFSYTNGQTGIVEVADTGYYVLTLHDRSRVEDATADVRHILFRAETADDSTAPSEDAWAAALAEAEGVLAEYQAGQQTAEAFGALAGEHSDDGGSNTNGGLYTGVAQGDFVPEFDEWLFDPSRKAGDVDIVRHEAGEDDGNPYWGYHIVYYVGQGDPVWANTADSTLREQAMESAVEELTSAYTATLGDGAEYLGK